MDEMWTDVREFPCYEFKKGVGVRDKRTGEMVEIKRMKGSGLRYCSLVGDYGEGGMLSMTIAIDRPRLRVIISSISP